MQGAFHGRTMGAMALTSSKTFYKTGFAPLMPGAFIAPFPYCLHCKVRQTASDGKDWYKVRTPLVLPVLALCMPLLVNASILVVSQTWTACPCCMLSFSSWG